MCPRKYKYKSVTKVNYIHLRIFISQYHKTKQTPARLSLPLFTYFSVKELAIWWYDDIYAIYTSSIYSSVKSGLPCYLATLNVLLSCPQNYINKYMKLCSVSLLFVTGHLNKNGMEYFKLPRQHEQSAFTFLCLLCQWDSMTKTIILEYRNHHLNKRAATNKLYGSSTKETGHIYISLWYIIETYEHGTTYNICHLWFKA